MLNISQRGLEMPSSPIRKLTPLANSAKERGVKVYHLNIGQPDLPTPKKALEALKNVDRSVLEYSPSQGFLSLREKLVKYYSKFNINLTPDDIIVTSGGSEAVLFAFLACLNPGDEIIVPEPAYANYMAFAVSAGAVIKTVTATIDTGFALPPVEKFEELITERTKAILICNPGNPTGTLYSKEEMLALGEIARKHDLFLISDEVYREFCYTDEPHFSAMNIKGLEDKVILIDSVSKRYNLCGARVGCIISRNKEVMAAAMKYAQSRLCPPVLGQIASIGALDTPDEYFAAVKEEYIRRRNYMIEGLNKIEGVYSPVPMGAFYTVAELPVDDVEEFAKWMLENFRIDNETTMVTPAASFYSTPDKGRNHARIAYVLEIDEMKKALRILEEGLKAYPGRTI